ncbi:MAG: MipA/OmpV family protein [Burkholderiaceae bacterium]
MTSAMIRRQRPFGRLNTPIFSSLLAVSLLVAAPFASAQTSDMKVGLGAELRIKQNIYRGVGSEFDLLPSLSINAGPVRVDGTMGRFDIYEHLYFDVSVIGQYRFEGYNGSDSTFLEGMGARRGALEIGLEMSSRQWFGDVAGRVLTDISSRHRGFELQGELGYPLSLAGGTVTPQVQLTYQSDRLTNYYFGVSAGEARADRPEYQPGNTINLGVGVRYDLLLAQRHKIFASLMFERYGNGIEGSPLRDSKDPIRIYAGYQFRF